MAKPIGTLGTIPSITIGGRVFTDLDNLLILGANMSGNKYWTFAEGNGTGDYQVPVGKTLQVLAVQTVCTTASNGVSILLYGDNAVDNSSTPPTNPVFQFNNKNSFSAQPGVHSFITDFEVPAGKYIHALDNDTSGSFGMFLFCYLV